MQAYLNELSLPMVGSSEEVITLFESFGNVYKNANLLGVKEVRIKVSFFEHEFAPNYFFNSWLEDDRNVEIDIRTLLKSIMTTAPFIDEILNTYEADHNTALEFSFNEERCYGIGLCSNLIFDTLTFSYFIEDEWTADHYNVTIKSLEENEAGDISDLLQEGESKNISCIDHIETHRAFIERKIRETIYNGNELWVRKEDLFRNLIFCENVKAQIINMNYNQPQFQQILNRLFELQRFVSTWDRTPIKPTDFRTKVTPESQTRLNIIKDKLTFHCPDGEFRLFNWHSRFTPNAGRIHFCPIPEEGFFYIGYIGIKID